ncbi:DUF6449 domain-containing protein [Lachnospiraceae bacterium 62-35]
MTSKNWFFKFLIEDIKRRLWAVALVTLLFFFSFPVVTVFMAGNRWNWSDDTWLRSFSSFMLGLVSKNNGWTATVIVILALVCAVSGFAWLDSKKKVDFYHSIPLRREKIFAINYLCGILIVAVPYTFNLFISACIAALQGVPSIIFIEALKGWTYFMVYYLMLYATVVIAVIMTGNLIVGLLGTGVFFFYFPLALLLTEGYFETWFYTYCGDERFMEYAKNLSPFINYCVGGSLTWKFFLIRLAVGLAFTGIALFLYKKRPSEASGKAMAFSVSKPIIRILIVMLSSLMGGLFCWSMRDNTGWAIFGLITGCLISHCVIEIIYHFDFKRLFSNYQQMIGCFVVSALILCIFRYDWFGYDRYIPKESSVKTASILVDNLDDWVDYITFKPYDPDKNMELYDRVRRQYGEDEIPYPPYDWDQESRNTHIFKEMKLQDVEPVLSIASQGVDFAMKKRKWEEDNRNRFTSETYGYRKKNAVYCSVTIQYQLKNGRTVQRWYSVEKEMIDAAVSKIFGQTEYKESVYPVLSLSPENVAAAEYERMGETITIPRDKQDILLEAYQEALMEMSLDDIKGCTPTGILHFFTEEGKALVDWERKTKIVYNDYRYYFPRYDGMEGYPIYESFHEVEAILKEESQELNDRTWERKIARIQLTDPRSYEGETIETFDESEIQELIPFIASSDYTGYNEYSFHYDDILEANVFFFKEEEEDQDGTDDNYYGETKEDRDLYDSRRYFINVSKVPKKYLDRLHYDELTEKIEMVQEK